MSVGTQFDNLKPRSGMTRLETLYAIKREVSEGCKDAETRAELCRSLTEQIQRVCGV